MELFYKHNSEDQFSFSYPPGLNFKLQYSIVQTPLHFCYRLDIENLNQSYQKCITSKPQQWWTVKTVLQP